MLDHITATTDDDVVSYATVEKKMRDMIAGVDANGNRDEHGRKFLFIVAGNNVDGGCGPSGVVDRFPPHPVRHLRPVFGERASECHDVHLATDDGLEVLSQIF